MSDQTIDQLKSENTKLKLALRLCMVEIDQYIWQEYPSDHPIHARYRNRDFQANPARVALGKDTDTEE